MPVLASRDRCSGCSACVAVCRFGAIVMPEDGEGFKYPFIEVDRCVDCGLCTQVCPVLKAEASTLEPEVHNPCDGLEESNSGVFERVKTEQFPVREPIAAYAVINKDKNIRQQSSSGGVFTLLASQVLSEGGVVYGAGWDRDWHVIHKSAESEDELVDLRGSKYVQSDLGDVFRRVKQQLASGRKILFSGTPCQIAGLRSFLLTSRFPIQSGQLLLVEVICMMVPSPRVFELYRQALCRKHKAPLTGFRFRDKGTGGGKNSMVVASFENGRIYRSLIAEDVFLRGFFEGLYCRPSCTKCSFRSLRSGADITVGDFWGVENVFPGFDDGMGVSVLLLNTSLGERFYNRLSFDITALPTTFSAVKAGNPALVCSFPAHSKRPLFFERFVNEPFLVLIERLLRRPFLFRIRLMLSRFRRMMLRGE